MAAFGDDSNDLELIKECGYGVAIGNAIDEVKVFLIKSAGTVFAGEVALLLSYLEITHFFLTPLVRTMSFIENNPCRVIVEGNDENNFPAENIKTLKNLPEGKLHVYDNADHSLETNDCFESLDILSEVVNFWRNHLMAL